MSYNLSPNRLFPHLLQHVVYLVDKLRQTKLHFFF